MLGIKQDALAFELGDDWNQKKISLLEQKETIDVPLLQQISAVLKIPVEAFQNFDEEKAIVNIQNNYEGANNGVTNVAGYKINDNCTFHPIEELRKLHEEKIALYERMLKEKDEMMAELKKLINNK